MLLGRVVEEPKHASPSSVRTIVPRTRAPDTLVYELLIERLRRTVEAQPRVHNSRSAHAGGVDRSASGPRAARLLFARLFHEHRPSLPWPRAIARGTSECGCDTLQRPRLAVVEAICRKRRGPPPAQYSDIDKLVDEPMKDGRRSVFPGSRRPSHDCEDCARPLQDAALALPSASSMMRRMVRAQRPHWTLPPRQP